MRRKIIGFILAFAMISGVAAGCGKTQPVDDSAATSKTEKSEKPEKSKKPKEPEISLDGQLIYQSIELAEKVQMKADSSEFAALFPGSNLSDYARDLVGIDPAHPENVTVVTLATDKAYTLLRAVLDEEFDDDDDKEFKEFVKEINSLPDFAREEIHRRYSAQAITYNNSALGSEFAVAANILSAYATCWKHEDYSGSYLVLLSYGDDNAGITVLFTEGALPEIISAQATPMFDNAAAELLEGVKESGIEYKNYKGDELDDLKTGEAKPPSSAKKSINLISKTPLEELLISESIELMKKFELMVNSETYIEVSDLPYFIVDYIRVAAEADLSQPKKAAVIWADSDALIESGYLDDIEEYFFDMPPSLQEDVKKSISLSITNQIIISGNADSTAAAAASIINVGGSCWTHEDYSGLHYVLLSYDELSVIVTFTEGNLPEIISERLAPTFMNFEDFVEAFHEIAGDAELSNVTYSASELADIIS